MRISSTPSTEFHSGEDKTRITSSTEFHLEEDRTTLLKCIVMMICMLSTLSLLSQDHEEISTFHRLLIFNAAEEMMVVKIKDKDVWVTPGHYQIPGQSPRLGMDSIAATYGLEIDLPTLGGMFMLTRKNSDNTRLRNVYFTQSTSEETQLPDIIDEVRWLSVEEAIAMITFDHINLLIGQVTSSPEAVWGGTVMSYKEDGVLKAEVTEGFYPLFECH